MSRPHRTALRERVVAYVEDGHSNKQAARYFRVSPRFVNNLMIRHRRPGTLEAKPQGRPAGMGKLTDRQEWLRQRLAESRPIKCDTL